MKKNVLKMGLVVALALIGFTQTAVPASATTPTCDIEFCFDSPYCKCQWGSSLYVCHRWIDLLYLD